VQISAPRSRNARSNARASADSDGPQRAEEPVDRFSFVLGGEIIFGYPLYDAYEVRVDGRQWLVSCK